MLTHIDAPDIQSGFAKAAELIYADTFIHEMELSFLHNGELVEQAVCEANTYDRYKESFPPQYDYSSADKITCRWSGPGLD
jgi:hypothetical protein